MPRPGLVNNVASRCCIIASESPVSVYHGRARELSVWISGRGRSGTRSLPFAPGLRSRSVHKITAEGERDLIEFAAVIAPNGEAIMGAL